MYFVYLIYNVVIWFGFNFLIICGWIFQLKDKAPVVPFLLGIFSTFYLLISGLPHIYSLPLLFLTTWAGICLAFNLSEQKCSLWSIIVSIFAVCVSSAYIAYQVNQDIAFQEKFPLVSLTERLAFEPPKPDSNPSHLGKAVPERLDEIERVVHSNWFTSRSRALSRIHRETSARFIDSPGFGQFRVPNLGTEWIGNLEEATPIPLPNRSQFSSDLKNKDLLPSERNLWDTHLVGIGEFAREETNGYIRDKDHVAGFLSHGFRKVPQIESEQTPSPFKDWQLVQLQLVSLLKFDSPQVYDSQELPRMEALNETSTRKLTTFEQEALSQLENGEDLVIDQHSNSIKMVGSLRAIQHCLECHQGSEGDLLGAFSYEFLIDLSPKTVTTTLLEQTTE